MGGPDPGALVHQACPSACDLLHPTSRANSQSWAGGRRGWEGCGPLSMSRCLRSVLQPAWIQRRWQRCWPVWIRHHAAGVVLLRRSLWLRLQGKGRRQARFGSGSAGGDAPGKVDASGQAGGTEGAAVCPAAPAAPRGGGPGGGGSGGRPNTGWFPLARGGPGAAGGPGAGTQRIGTTPNPFAPDADPGPGGLWGDHLFGAGAAGPG